MEKKKNKENGRYCQNISVPHPCAELKPASKTGENTLLKNAGLFQPKFGSNIDKPKC